MQEAVYERCQLLIIETAAGISFDVAANYLENWKCIHKLKGDGSGSRQGQDEAAVSDGVLVPVPDAAASLSIAAGSRYYNLAPLGSRSEVPWH